MKLLKPDNGILIVEFAKEKREQGWPLHHAATEGSRERFRPVMMTSLAFILGLLPLVVATGASELARRNVGTPVFGGMDLRLRIRHLRHSAALHHLPGPARAAAPLDPASRAGAALAAGAATPHGGPPQPQAGNAGRTTPHAAGAGSGAGSTSRSDVVPDRRIEGPEHAERIADSAVAVAPEHAFHRHDDLRSRRDRARPPCVDVVDRQEQADLRRAQGVAMLGQGIAEHHRVAIDAQMDVHGPPLAVGGMAGDFLGAECLLVERGGLERAVDGEIRHDAADDLRLGFARLGLGCLRLVHVTSPLLRVGVDAQLAVEPGDHRLDAVGSLQSVGA